MGVFSINRVVFVGFRENPGFRFSDSPVVQVSSFALKTSLVIKNTAVTTAVTAQYLNYL